MSDRHEIVTSQLGGGRNEYLDSLKFYLIFVVVLGHCLWENYHSSKTIDILLYWIYTFHMPLFVFISGYLSKKKDSHRFLDFFLKTIETYLLFQTACVLLQYIKGVPITWRVIISPYSIYWYLFSLLLWRTIIQVVPDNWMERHKVFIPIVAAIGLIVGFVPIGNEFSFQRTFAFLPFFVLGFYSHKYGWLDRIRSLSWSVVICVLVGCLLVFYLCASRDVFTMSLLYENTPYHSALECLFRLVIWILAIGNSIVIIKIIRSGALTALLGALTLYIFVYHQFVIEIVMKVAERLSVPQNIFVIALEAVFVTGVCCVIARVPLFRYIVNPITSLIKRK